MKRNLFLLMLLLIQPFFTTVHAQQTSDTAIAMPVYLTGIFTTPKNDTSYTLTIYPASKTGNIQKYLAGSGKFDIEPISFSFKEEIDPLAEDVNFTSDDQLVSYKGKIVYSELTGVITLKTNTGTLTLQNEGTSYMGTVSGTSPSAAPPVSVLIFTIAGALLFLLAYLFLIRYLYKIYSRLFDLKISQADEAIPSYPMVRISRHSFFWRRRAVILYEESIAVFKKTKSRSIAALHEDDSETIWESFKGIYRKKKILLEDVKRITVKPRRVTRASLFIIRTKAGKFKLLLPEYESRHFLKALTKMFPGKVAGSKMSIVRSLLFGLILSALVCYGLYKIPYDTMAWYQIFFIQAFVWIFILVVLCALPLVFASYDLRRTTRPVTKKKPEDLSYRKPLRSNILAFTLRLLAIVLLLAWLFSSLQDYIPFLYMSVAVGSLLLVSIALAQKTTDRLRKNDTRKPILYLRSFLDDNQTTLNPCTKRSSFLGIDPPYYTLINSGLEEGVRYTIGKFMIKYLFSFMPLRLIRLFFSQPRDTSEEQLTHYFKKHGLVVAIGKPGERLTTLGASRLYVTNEEWQQTVTDLLQESQIVLLQPSATDGVWWEIDKVLKECKPENVILCMVNYRNHQEKYEHFYRRFTAINPNIKIPRSLGNENKISFITFDKDWQPVVTDLKYYSIIRWPFTGNALNLGATFKTYFDKRKMETVVP
jgi:hypothetical protein